MAGQAEGGLDMVGKITGGRFGEDSWAVREGGGTSGRRRQQ